MIEKLRLEIPLVLPGVTSSADACVDRLISQISGPEGVESAHVRTSDTGTHELCIHYDPNVVALPRIRELVESTGARISERFGHLDLQTNVSNQRRANTIAEHLRSISGVLEAEASASGSVRVEFDREKTSEPAILAALQKLRVDVEAAPKPKSSGDHDHAHEDHGSKHDHAAHEGHNHGSDHEHTHGFTLFGLNSEFLFSLVCGGFLALGFAIETLTSAPHWLPLAAYLAAYFFGGFYTLREAIESLGVRKFEIDTLMLVAAAGAAALGAFAEGALLLFLFSLGHALEHFAMGRAKKAIEALRTLAPQTAFVRRNGKIEEIPVESLVIGDVVLVKPDARLPADGFLIKGTSSVNQAPITGESVPVDKQPVPDPAQARANPNKVTAAYRVFAGTINGSGSIEIEVTRAAADTTLAKVVQMVTEAETQRSPTQRFTDRFERIFVPLVLITAIVLLFAGLVVDEPFSASFYRAMAVLVAASPCALAIATPSAVLSGVARAARGGVLVKGGAPLENLGSLRAIAFDKTGTLTEGQPRITDIMPSKGITESDLLSAAIPVERLSDHPLAHAIVRDGTAKLSGVSLPEAADLQNFVGRGVSATLGGEKIWIGKAELFGSEGIPDLAADTKAAIQSLRDRGRTTMVVRRGMQDLGAIGLMDRPRDGAKSMIARLKQLGFSRLIMISGDHQKVAEAIAKEVGLDEAWGDLMPEDKVKAIKKLRSEGKVAMVGDGVNDAPAMASATVGIAMGAAGSDVALETADVALMADDLSNLPFAVSLSRATRSIILQNVIVSMGVVALLVPSTIAGLSIGAAVAAHEGSTILVVVNALRLLAYRNKG
jgi:Cd2+/Zn2+-exporting ATPase